MFRNMNARNFGLKSRDMVKAATNAYREHESSYGSIDTYTSHFRQFAGWLHSETGIKDMRWIQKGDVVAYAENLANRVEKGELDNDTAHNHVSAINVALSQARSDKQVHISASQYLPPRNYIATESRAATEETTRETIALIGTHSLGERLEAMIDLQRLLGLRFEESAKANPSILLREAISKGRVTIVDGTKGGRAREVPITSDKQLTALERAAKIQGCHHSMIPKELSYFQFQTAGYRAIQDCPIKGFHDFRNTYAHMRYVNLVGVPCPVAIGVGHGKPHHQYIADQLGTTFSKAKEIDHDARKNIAEELGHARLRITNSYLG